MNDKRFKLIQGDCLEIMPKLANDGVKVDLVLTDPPYGTTSCKWDNIIPFEPMWDCLNQLTYDKTPIALFGSQPFTSNLIQSNLNNFKYELIWDKVQGKQPFLAKMHPTEKPIELLEYLIKTYTNEEDIVLDFTMGSGSTGVACLQTNRNFIGIELEPKYYEIARTRIKEAKAQKRLI